MFEPFGGPAEVQFLGDGDESGQLVEGKHDAFPVSLDAYLGLDMHHSALPTLDLANRQ